MEELIKFEFEGKNFEAINIEGEPYFVAKDICNILDNADVSKTLLKVHDEDKLVRKIFVSGQMRDVLLVNESGLYTLLLKSNKPQAKSLQRHVTSVILPTIRKTGSYTIAHNAPVMDRDQIALHTLQSLIETKSRIEAIEEKVKMIEAQSVTSPMDFFAIAGYASLMKIKVDSRVAAKIGKKASALCRDLGYMMGNVPDAKYGMVHTYPSEVLKIVFDEHFTVKA